MGEQGLQRTQGGGHLVLTIRFALPLPKNRMLIAAQPEQMRHGDDWFRLCGDDIPQGDEAFFRGGQLCDARRARARTDRAGRTRIGCTAQPSGGWPR